MIKIADRSTDRFAYRSGMHSAFFSGPDTATKPAIRAARGGDSLLPLGKAYIPRGYTSELTSAVLFGTLIRRRGKLKAYCIGCLYAFNAETAKQYWCSKACRLEHRYHHKAASPVRIFGREHVLDADCIALRAHLKKCRRRNTIGYVLYDPDNGVKYPFLGRSRRFRGNMSDLPYFELDPYIELPLVGKAGLYELSWYMKDGSLVPEKVNTVIEIKYSTEVDYRAIRRAQLQTQMPLRAYTKTHEANERKRIADTGFGALLPNQAQRPQIAAARQTMILGSYAPPEPETRLETEPARLLASLDVEQVNQLPPEEKQRIADGVRQLLSASGIDMHELLTTAGIATDDSSEEEPPPSGPAKRRKPKKNG